jgi:hypothetical protein
VTNTQRVTGALTEGSTKRVGSFVGASFRNWGNSWGESWGQTWRTRLSGTAIGITQRITGSATANNTKRVA